MRVPLLDLSLHHAPLKAEIMEAVERLVDANAFILGAEVERFEERLAAAAGTKYAVGMSSGTDALLATLMALGIGPEDEVVTTPFSFFATAGAIARTGARPVFADVEAESFNLDPTKAAAAVTPRTRAILPVHLYGRVAHVGPLLDLAGKRGLAIVEDACQAIGATDAGGNRAGGLGRAGCFSFYPTKNVGGMGDAGGVTTGDEGLAAKLRLLRNHGSERRYFHRTIGGNFRLDALQAAVLNVKIGHLAEWNAARRAAAERYDLLLRGAALPERGVVPPSIAAGHVFHQYVIRAPRRDALREHLAGREIGTEVFYPVPFHLQECFAFLGHKEGDFPEAERACREVLALPLYPELTADQQAWVVESITAFYRA